MIIIVSPYSKKLQDTYPHNPKNYPFWYAVTHALIQKGDTIIQIGKGNEQTIPATSYKFDLSLKDLRILVEQCDTWISVDNFFPHFCACHFPNKPGIVLWGVSNPRVYGYPTNTNLVGDFNYIASYQFGKWQPTQFNTRAFSSAEEVLASVEKFR